MADERRVDTEDMGRGRADAESAAAAESSGGVVAGDGGPGAGSDPNAAAPDGSEVAELEVLQREIEDLNDRHLRLMAEFDNYRKRVDRERSEGRIRSQAELLARMLDALDDLHRLVDVDVGSTSVDALLEGARLVDKKLRQTLESAGLEPIEPEGELFDPSTMEALMTVPAEHPEEDEVVADVFQKGYRYNDLLIRPARVRVKKYE